MKNGMNSLEKNKQTNYFASCISQVTKIILQHRELSSIQHFTYTEEALPDQWSFLTELTLLGRLTKADLITTPVP